MKKVQNSDELKKKNNKMKKKDKEGDRSYGGQLRKEQL